MANPRNYYTQIPGSAIHDTNSTPPTVYTVAKSKVASRTGSDYSKRKPLAKFLPPTSYSMTEYSQTHASGSTSWAKPSVGIWGVESGSALHLIDNPETQRNATIPSVGLSETFPSGLANRALIKARANLKSQDINLGQAYGERRQTARLVSTNLQRIISGLKRFKRTHPKRWLYLLRHNPDGLVRAIPDWWLEVVYGWKPLLSDVYGACDALDKRDKSDWRVTVFGKASQRGQISSKPLYTNGGSKACFADATVFHGCKVRIDAVPINEALRSASSFGLTNPLSLAWELTPWSFVFDWWFPLGPYLDQMDATLGWEIKGYSSSNFSIADWRWRGRTYTASGWTYTNSWSSSRRFVRLVRTASSSVPFPVFPTLKDPFSSSLRVGTALALLAGLVRSK